MGILNDMLKDVFDISKIKDAVSELKKMDTLLTRISRTNERLSRSDLAGLGSRALRVAGRYGMDAAGYLAAFQEASRAGYEDAEGMAELSMAAQNAGSITAELADRLLSATDQAYRMGGSVSELTKVLDGLDRISGRNALDMAELSEGMAGLGSTAASLGVDASQAAAALGTLITVSRQSGSQAADAFKTILLCLGQITDAEAGITVKGLKRYEAACKALNVSLYETRDGIRSLRDPMKVLEELAAAYSRLGEDDTRRSSLLDSLGDSASAEGLDALLSRWDTYEAMLQQYADGTGSLAADAEKTTNSWEGSLNRLSNTWTETVGNLADSDAIVAAINSLNGLLSAVNSLTAGLGLLGTTALSGAGIGIAAFVKNFA